MITAVIMVMKGCRDARKNKEADYEERQVLAHFFTVLIFYLPVNTCLLIKYQKRLLA